MIRTTKGNRDWTEKELQLSKLKIEKNVPIRTRYPHGAFKNLASKMKVGDSIYCEDERQINGIAAHLNKLGWKYETRREDRGRRIWRIK